ncbi:hypothetical protein SAMD00019534_092180, partial [Acytostelium subglobosum LB1]|uniref:hypothetical protein n=1 Tax=Acytostelium subglobosum LB1 TaxID=1410327 RepID=UPI00064487E7
MVLLVPVYHHNYHDLATTNHFTSITTSINESAVNNPLANRQRPSVKAAHVVSNQ